MDHLPNPLGEDKGKLDVLITDLENFFSYPKLLPLPSSISILDEDTNFLDRANIYIHHNGCIDKHFMDMVYLLLKSPEYLLHKETDKLDHLFY